MDICKWTAFSKNQPGICTISHPCMEKAERGLYVPKTKNSFVFLKIGIRDPVSNSVLRLRFLVDTGSIRTIIPRKLIIKTLLFNYPGKSISLSCPMKNYVLQGLRYNARLFIPTDEGLYIDFKDIEIVTVTYGWEPNFCVLGIDALNSILTIMNDKYFAIWNISEKHSNRNAI